MVQRLTFESPDAKARKTQRDILVQGALAAQNAIKNKAPLELPAPPPAPPTMPASDPLAALVSGGAGGAALNGLGTAPAPPPPGSDPMAALMAPPPGAAPMPAPPPPVPAFAGGGMMPGVPGAAPPIAGTLGATGPITGEGEPRIDLPAPAPEPTAMTSPEPYELDPSIVTADRLIDILIRAQQGEDPNALVADATRPRTRLPRENPRMVEQMAQERAPILEPPGSFLRWLAATKPEETEGVGRELVEIYQENPDTAADLWGIVQSGLISEERESLPGDLLRMLRSSDKPVVASDRLRLPSTASSRKSRATGY